MIDISVNAVDKFYGDVQILRNITFDIQEGEKVGLLGKNGAGKTTLFHLLSGKEPFEAGSIAIPKNKTLGILDQIPSFPTGTTVDAVLRLAFSELDNMRNEMKTIEREMARSHDKAIIDHYGELAARYEALGGYETAHEIDRVCNGLMISKDMRGREFSALSGGERTRINLARLFLKKTEILLLDEPTNHLDTQSSEWLEEWLVHYKGTVLTISHDRCFLDHAVTRIIEITGGSAELYAGNYSFYVKERDARYQFRLAQYEREQKKMSELQASIHQMRTWAESNTNLYKRAKVMEGRLARMGNVEKPVKERSMKATFEENAFHSDEVMTINSIHKKFGERIIIDRFTQKIYPGERIALIGNNGIGKTTLLEIIMKKQPPDSGSVRMGPSVKAGFLPQIIQFQNEEATLLDILMYDCGCTHDQARNRLAAFKFRGNDVFKTVSVLSGGEKSRLYLCILMGKGINFLVLDEPTNHLDLQSREWIEEAVEDFEGTLLFVSHDRYFLNRFATCIWDMTDRNITVHPCGYEKYRETKLASETNAVPQQQKKSSKLPNSREEKRIARVKLAACEREIHSLEQRISQIDTEMTQNPSDAELLVSLIAERSELCPLLDAKYEEWAELGNDTE